jgi:hypothetical protein
VNVVDVITIAICAYGLLFAVFVVGFYHLVTGGHWREHEIGWLIVLPMLDLGLIFGLIGSTRTFGDWPGRRGVVIALVAFLALTPLWWLRVIWHAHPQQVSVMKGIAMSTWQRYGKAFMSVLGSIAVLAYLYLNDGDRQIDRVEGVQLAIVGTQSLLVYVVPLASHARWAKSATEWVLAALLALASVIVDGWQPWTDGIVIVVAVLTAAGVTISPARSDNGISAHGSSGARVG